MCTKENVEAYSTIFLFVSVRTNDAFMVQASLEDIVTKRSLTLLFACVAVALYAVTASAVCRPDAICLAEDRYEVTVDVMISDDHRVAATPLFLRGDVAYFSAVSGTSDPFNPDIAVKVVDFRPAFGSFLIFHAPLTHFPYTVTVRDTATGETKVFKKDLDSFCGAVDSLPAIGSSAKGDPPAVQGPIGCGNDPHLLCLFGGRFGIRLTARTTDQATVPGTALPYNESFGSFSLPTLTGDGERAEVAVKLIDGFAVDGSVWVFHSALTHLPYTLEITDNASGAKQTYAVTGEDHCGGSILGRIPSEPCRAAASVSISGGDTITAGSSTTLQAHANGTQPFRYQWRRKLTDGSFVDIPGAIAAQYETGSLQLTTTFAVRVESGCGVAQERSVAVAVRPNVATLTVRKRGAGLGSINASLGDLKCGDGTAVCTATFPAGSRVRLTAAATVDSAFSGWSGACGGVSSCTVTLDSDQTVNARFEAAMRSVVMPDGGGTATLDGIGNVRFAGGALPPDTTVTLTTTRSGDTKSDFDTTAVLFAPTARSAYELRINTGTAIPAADIHVTLQIPPQLNAATTTGEIQVLAQVFEDGGDEVLDSFELFPSSVSGSTITTTLPPETFTNRRTADGSYEAIVVIAVTPTKPSSSPGLIPTAASANRELPLPPPKDATPGRIDWTSLITATSSCQGASLGSPIAGTAPVTSAFDPPAHYGTDFGVPNGTPIQSMADGVVTVVGNDSRPLTKPDPRSGKLVKGWGRYVVVKHSDGSASLYAHLEMTGVIVSVNQRVSRGDVLATSDNSGGSSGPHLHVEYAPNGALFGAQGRASKVDPAPCIGSNVDGSITVRDNGPLADDAFAVFINNVQICSTSIGASNTCAANNLRPGTVTLTLQCTVAPDDVGTYEVSLSRGLVFEGGGTSRSGTLPQGASHSFAVIVPQNP
jgi:murein DD-endopeptidase MepM/ murein hydrolase activator NlpD